MSGDVDYALLRFAQYGLLLGLFGYTAFRRFGLKQTLGASTSRLITPGLKVVATVALFASVVLMWVSIASMMAQPAVQVEWSTISAIVSTTDLGWAFLARTVSLVAAAGTCLFFARAARAHAVATFLFGLSLLTLPWSGHAAAGEGGLGLIHRLNDAVHLLAAGYWLGAIVWFFSLTVAVHRQRSVRTAGLLKDMHKFAPIGALLVVIIAATGATNAQMTFGVENSLAVFQTDYGGLLSAKILLVCAMLIFGARNAWVVRLSKMSHNRQADLVRLRMSLAVELALVLGVIGLMAYIGMMSPIGD